MKKYLFAAVCICLVSCIAVIPNAYAGIMASEVISSYSVTTSSDSSGNITAVATIRAVSKSDKIGFPVIRIQEKQGSSWVTVKSASGKYKTDATSYSYSLSYDGTVGKAYRCYAEFYAENDGVSDTRSKTSSSITAG
jgi:hypothetical protein